MLRQEGHDNLRAFPDRFRPERSEEHTSELQSRQYLVCRLLLEKKTTILSYSTDTSAPSLLTPNLIRCLLSPTTSLSLLSTFSPCSVLSTLFTSFVFSSLYSSRL